MPESVSPARTVCTTLRAPPEALAAAVVRGTWIRVPAMMTCRSRMWFFVTRTPTVVRCRVAIPSRVSPARTVYGDQPCGAVEADVTATDGSISWGGTVAGGAMKTMTRP